MAKRVYGFSMVFGCTPGGTNPTANCNLFALDGDVVFYPVGGAYVGETPSIGVAITATDTLATIRSKLAALVPAAYGENIPLIWMDDKGLL